MACIPSSEQVNQMKILSYSVSMPKLPENPGMSARLANETPSPLDLSRLVIPVFSSLQDGMSLLLMGNSAHAEHSVSSGLFFSV